MQSKSHPKITVITPTYNRANFITETIESVLAQDFPDFEYFILDDGSTDNTAEVIEPYLSDNRVKYLFRKNSGEPETVNWGWQLAKGDYFVQINSDDPVLPGLFAEMVRVLDKHPKCVLAYPDFYIIDKKGNIIKRDRNTDWNFLKNLSDFACYAASPGTFIRKSAFANWSRIRKTRFKHINDVDMLWDMALIGDFIRVPKFLATWRSHDGGISANRWQSIPEIEMWFNWYFSKPDLPKKVLACKPATRKSINKYCIQLLKQVNIGDLNEQINAYEQKLGGPAFKYKNLQIGDNDLIGNKFNGHDLHLYLRQRGVDASHLVWNKESTDKHTYLIAGSRSDRLTLQQSSLHVQKTFQLNSLNNPLVYSILYNDLFLEANIVHYHLINNHIFDINLLPLMTRLKPSVWTIHDPWSLGGHCIHHFDCEKWKTHCGDCPYLTTNFPLEKDNSALNFEIKKTAIQNSKLDIIVASKWMEQKVTASPMFKNATVHLVPFGINQQIFKPLNKFKVRQKLGIPPNALTLAFRCDASPFKGLEFIEHTLKNLHTDQKIFLLVLGNQIRENPRNYPNIEFGWVKEDRLLAEIYNASDLFLMPSKVEAFGMMAIEAMSCGTLPIVMDGTSLPEVVNSTDCGVSVPQDKDAYLQAVQHYINHPKERKTRSQACIEYARTHYGLDTYLSKIMAVYDEAIKKHVLSDSDRYLLTQLKRHMVDYPVRSTSYAKGQGLSFWHKQLLIGFYKIDKIVPKHLRRKLKPTLMNIRPIKSLLEY